MKVTYIFFALLFVYKSCNPTAQDSQDLISIHYQSYTKASVFECTINKSRIKIIKTGFDAFELDNTVKGKNWKRLELLVSEIDMKKINSLKSSTEERASDKSATGKLIIKTKNETYSSSLFDDHNPPESLVELVDKIYTLAEESRFE